MTRGKQTDRDFERETERRYRGPERGVGVGVGGRGERGGYWQEGKFLFTHTPTTTPTPPPPPPPPHPHSTTQTPARAPGGGGGGCTSHSEHRFPAPSSGKEGCRKPVRLWSLGALHFSLTARLRRQLADKSRLRTESSQVVAATEQFAQRSKPY